MNPISVTRTVDPNLSSNQAAQLQAIAKQQRVTDYPYYSSVCFRVEGEKELDDNGAPAGQIYWFRRGELRRAFAYARGQDGQIAGFNVTNDGLMTLAETNLVKPHETIGGQQVQIDGLAIFIKPAMTDGERFMQARLLAQIATNVSIQLSVNGDENMFPVGTLQQVPGAGGLVGIGNDDLAFKPPIQIPDKGDICEVGPGVFPFAANGWQTRGNYYRLPSGVIWNPAGNADSMLNVVFTNERGFALRSGGTPEQEQVWCAQEGKCCNPETIGVVLTVQLIAQVVGQRTRTA
jgi:hypothetical protein